MELKKPHPALSQMAMKFEEGMTMLKRTLNAMNHHLQASQDFALLADTYRRKEEVELQLCAHYGEIRRNSHNAAHLQCELEKLRCSTEKSDEEEGVFIHAREDLAMDHQLQRGGEGRRDVRVIRLRLI